MNDTRPHFQSHAYSPPSLVATTEVKAELNCQTLDYLQYMKHSTSQRTQLIKDAKFNLEANYVMTYERCPQISTYP